MKMDLQKFADDDQQKQDDNQQPNNNDSSQQKGQNDDLSKKLSNALSQFQGMNKKMTDFFKNQGNSAEQKSSQSSEEENKSSEKPKEPQQGQQNGNSDYEERIAKLEKQLQDQQNKSNKNDLAKYTTQKIKDSGLDVDNDTFQHLQGQTKDAIDKNIDWYKGLTEKFNKPNKPAPKSFNNKGNNNGSNNSNTVSGPKPKSFDNGIGKFLK